MVKCSSFECTAWWIWHTVQWRLRCKTIPSLYWGTLKKWFQVEMNKIFEFQQIIMERQNKKIHRVFFWLHSSKDSILDNSFCFCSVSQHSVHISMKEHFEMSIPSLCVSFLLLKNKGFVQLLLLFPNVMLDSCRSNRGLLLENSIPCLLQMFSNSF